MNIAEFSQQLGVSTATVSRAFTGRGRISPKTRDHILARARELGYTPNVHARGMTQRRTDVLALFYESQPENLCDSYTAELAFGISHAAARAGRTLQMHAVPPGTSIARLEGLVCGGGVDGFLVYMGRDWAPALVTAGQRAGVPCLQLDNTRTSAPGVLSLGASIEAGARRVGEYLAQTGRRRPAFIHGIDDAGKLAGFRAGLGTAVAALITDPGGTTYQAGYDGMARLLALGAAAPDAVFAANDVLAIGALRAAADRGLQVPQELAVVGCDDLQMARFCVPALTTLCLPRFALADLAVARLLALVEGEAVSDSVDLECPLILRGST